MNKSYLLPLITLALPFAALQAQTPAAEPVKDDFESYEVGKEPDLFILEGDFTVETDGTNKVLQMKALPLVDGVVQLGASLKDGGEIQARFKAAQAGRSYPRFGVGLHGNSGYRLRVVPARKLVELVKNEEVIQTVPFTWATDQWYCVKLRAQPLADGRWSISGWAWPEAGEAPKQALIEYIGEDQKLQGKASVMGTPYSGKPIWIDNVEIRAVE